MLSQLVEKFEIGGEWLGFLWRNRIWWMFPIATILLLFGILIVVGSTTGVGPFVYTLF